MKKSIFTLMALVALVLVAGTSFAQSTPQYPLNGETETYTVEGLTAGDSVFFFVSYNDTTFFYNGSTDSLTAAEDGVFEWASSNTSVLASGETSATVDIEWHAAVDTFNVWIGVKDGNTGCYNFRYTPIIIRWDVQLFAVAIGDTSEYYTDRGLEIIDWAKDTLACEGQDTVTECAIIEPATANYNDTLQAGEYATGVSADGATWIYYRIVRFNALDTDNNWTFNFYANATAGTTTTAADSLYDIEYCVDPDATSPVWVTAFGTGNSDLSYSALTKDKTSTFNQAVTVNAAVDTVYARVQVWPGNANTGNFINVLARIDNTGATATENTYNPTELNGSNAVIFRDMLDKTDDVTVRISDLPKMSTNGFGFTGF